MLNRLRHIYQNKFALFDADYRKFLKMKGFKTFNDFLYHRRGFIECQAPRKIPCGFCQNKNSVDKEKFLIGAMLPMSSI